MGVAAVGPRSAPCGPRPVPWLRNGIIAFMTEFENGVDAGAPAAKRVPQERMLHGDTFVDDYGWLRDKDSAEVREYVAAQNRYCAMRMEPLKTLRTTLFEEFKSHVQETDMSVPTRMDGYWYFTRTKQGEQYGVQCRLPIRGDDDWDPPHIEAGVPIDGEQIVFDTNVEAKGHDFFRIGFTVSIPVETNATISAYAILKPERSCRRCSKESPGHALRRMRNGSSTPCLTTHGAPARLCVTM